MRRAAWPAALLCLALTASPVSGGSVESYMTYRIRLVRLEASYHADPGLARLADQRATEAGALPFPWIHPHRQLTEVPCAWGEILGRTRLRGDAAVRWIMAAWRRSPTHWDVLSGSWAYYGVGTAYERGYLVMAVIFADCRITVADRSAPR